MSNAKMIAEIVESYSMPECLACGLRYKQPGVKTCDCGLASIFGATKCDCCSLEYHVFQQPEQGMEATTEPPAYELFGKEIMPEECDKCSPNYKYLRLDFLWYIRSWHLEYYGLPVQHSCAASYDDYDDYDADFTRGLSR